MKKIKNILVPTDFSEVSENAMPYAIDLIKKNEGKLSLLNVYELPLMTPVNVFSSIGGVGDTMSDVAEDMYTLAMNKLKEIDTHNLAKKYFAKRGAPQEEIIDIIKENDIDLVVMGTKGESSEKGFLMSSTTRKVVQNCSCPVLAIPQEATFNKISEIVYATNLLHDETGILNYLVEFAKLYDATITVVHVDYDTTIKEWSIDLLQELIDEIDYPKISFQELVVKDVAKGISDFVVENKIDVLAMTTYSTTFFEKLFSKSITKEVLLHTQIPLLAFNRLKYDTILLS